MKKIDSFEHTIGYTFKNSSLLECALTHRSASSLNNERLEFLGDSVLSFVISCELFGRFPDAREGDLSRIRARLVKGDTLAELAKKLGLNDFVRLGSGELKSGGFRRKSILADTLEAVICAIYLDAGIDEARNFVLKLFKPLIDNPDLGKNLKDPKTRLQELMQAKGEELPVYEIIKTTGKSHNQVFEVSCSINWLETPVTGTGSSRRKAEQAAAGRVLEMIEAND